MNLSSAEQDRLPEKKSSMPVSPDAGSDKKKGDDFFLQAPSVSLPKGGGAIKSIDEKFSVNAVNGTGALNIPLPVAAARQETAPSMSLSYNSGSGNS